MAYTTEAKLTERFGEDELKQVAPDGSGGIASAKVTAAISAADAEINSYLVARWTVPLTPTPLPVEEAAALIARYRLHDDRATERIRQDYEDTRAWLKDAAAGRANPDPQNVTGQTTTAKSAGISVRGQDRVFTDANVFDRMP